MQLQIDGLSVPNPSSPCGLLGSVYTPLHQGTQGLVTGAYQLDPVPTFNAAGDSRAGAIIQPVRYLTTDLGLATTCADQGEHPTPSGVCAGGQEAAVPSLSAEAPGAGGCPATATDWCVYGDLSALTASWAGVPIRQLLSGPGTCVDDSGCFDQGVASGPDLAPSSAVCPAASSANPCSLAGSFDPATGNYRLDVHTTTPLGILPAIDAHYVLTGVFTPGPPALSLLQGGNRGNPGAGASAPASGKPTGLGGSDPGAAGTSAAGASAPTGTAAQSPVLAADTAQVLTGTLDLAPAGCTGEQPTGSYMIASYGSGAEPNSASSCDHGAVTTLSPGTSGLRIGEFTPDPVPTFDASGNSLSGSIIQPTAFGSLKFGMATSPDDVQDAPAGPAIYSPPEAIVEGQTLLVDLRSLEVTYNGPSGSSCADSFGQGCWEEGVRTAVGTFDPASDDWTLDWQASQGFTGQAAGTIFHLQGHFAGQLALAPPGTGDGWLPAQYVVAGRSTQTSTQNGTGSALAPRSAAAGKGGAGASIGPGSASSDGGVGGRGGSGGQSVGAVHPPDTKDLEWWFALLIAAAVLVSVGSILAVIIRRRPVLASTGIGEEVLP